MNPALDVIYARCKQVGAHWVWQGSMSGDGRPIVHIGHRSSVPVRRLVLEARIGEIPAGRYACCTCDVDGCIEHVKALNRKEQMALAAAAGKLTLPTRTANLMAAKRKVAPKMTMEKAEQLRTRRKEGATLHQLADEFGIHFSLAHRICNGKSWAKPPHPITSIPTPPGRFAGAPREWHFSSMAIGSYLPSQTAIARAYQDRA